MAKGQAYPQHSPAGSSVKDEHTSGSREPFQHAGSMSSSRVVDPPKPIPFHHPKPAHCLPVTDINDNSEQAETSLPRMSPQWNPTIGAMTYTNRREHSRRVRNKQSAPSSSTDYSLLLCPFSLSIVLFRTLIQVRASCRMQTQNSTFGLFTTNILTSNFQDSKFFFLLPSALAFRWS
jgi:hypothetical protein